MAMPPVGLSRKQIDEYRNFIFHDDSNYNLIVSRLLSVLGFKPSLCGTGFVREAIKFCCEQPLTTKFRFSSDVYPVVAEVCGVSSDCVERDIRTALHNCYNSGGMLKFNSICGYEIVSAVYPPTNVDFVTQTVTWIKSYSPACTVQDPVQINDN